MFQFSGSSRGWYTDLVCTQTEQLLSHACHMTGQSRHTHQTITVPIGCPYALTRLRSQKSVKPGSGVKHVQIEEQNRSNLQGSHSLN